MIRLSRAIKRYDTQGPDALCEVDLEVPTGQHLSLVGPSGSGKSTLLNLIAGLDRPTTGAVEVAGQELGRLDEDGLAHWRGRNVGIVFQFFQLLPSLSLRENLLLSMDVVGRIPRTERASRAHALLAEVGLDELSDRLPSEVSGGQQQRAAIARALANDPPLVVADEPTGNLDSTSAAGVLDVLAKLVERNRTVVVVTHDRDVAARGHRTVRLRDGQIVADDGRQP